ncbi:MAG: phosphate ABC transporter substrate-binding protein PstS [Gemmatimonadaceae bacterium]
MTRRILGMAAAAIFTACGGDGRQGANAPQTSRGVALTGAGATFPYPLYSKWFANYANQTGVRINYQPIGSGGGIRQITEGTVDFGASDGPMTDEQLARAKYGRILHFPSVLGAVVVTYNLPNVSGPLKLTSPVIADIFLGKIKKWNDPRIAQLNPGGSLPATDLIVVHRSDGSGTTYVFTDYLSAVSPNWARSVGRGTEVGWPTGLGAKGNEGVSSQVKQTPGAIGYVELAYAKQNRLAYASIRNPVGNFVLPSIQSVTAAAASAASKLGLTTDYRVSIVNAPGAQAYPISSFTWLLVYHRHPDPAKGRTLADFLRWAYTTGQQSAPSLDYAPLPPELADRLRQRVDSLQVGATT